MTGCMAAVFKLLSVAAATGRVGYVFLIDGQLINWGVSRKAWRSTAHAAGVLQMWINEYRPNVVVTEKFEGDTRKAAKSQLITHALVNTAAHNYVLDVAVSRVQRYANKYEEAAALAARYPDLAPWVPKRRPLLDIEPRSTMIFEALSLAQTVLDGPALALAAGMDGR